MTELGITVDADFRRIEALPRRQWSQPDLFRLAEYLTAELKTPSGTMELFPLQAQAIAEMIRCDGLYTSAPVGIGKTIISVLAATVLKARNPALFVPASLKRKTFRDLAELRQHWRIPRILPVLTYELLQHAKQRRLLLDRRFDLIICDEVDNLKIGTDILGPRVRRLLEYFDAYPDTKFVGLTGTPIRTSLMDFWLHTVLALKVNAPLPMTRRRAEEWAEAIDFEPRTDRWASVDDPTFERDPSALMRLGDGTEHDAIEIVQKRLTQSWGFVNVAGMSCDRPIHLDTIEDLEIPDIIRDALRQVDKSRETLNGDVLDNPLEIAQYKKQLICGFFYLWDPAPPTYWLNARKRWRRFVIEALERGGYADSPALVEAENRDHPDYIEWKRVEGDFDTIKNRKVAWIDDYLINDIAQRVDRPTIIWVGYRELGIELSKQTRWKYYGDGQRAGIGIMNETGARPIIASIDAHHAGKNLQAFSRNLVPTPRANASEWEQLIGRTHRYGQNRDVDLGVYQHAIELRKDFGRALRRARYNEKILAQPQKLLFASAKGNESWAF